MPRESADPNEIRDSDIVFDCPHCQKSLAIDCRGAGLTITCPDCTNKIQVPIPEGMEIFDIDSTDQDKEVRIIHMREVISVSQDRILQLESEVKDLVSRRDSLEKLRLDNAIRFDVIGKELEIIGRAMARISEVLSVASESIKRT
jgi:transcription elongation factor Elf1